MMSRKMEVTFTGPGGVGSPRSRREGAIVPGALSSSSDDGQAGGLAAGPPVADATASECGERRVAPAEDVESDASGCVTSYVVSIGENWVINRGVAAGRWKKKTDPLSDSCGPDVQDVDQPLDMRTEDIAGGVLGFVHRTGRFLSNKVPKEKRSAYQRDLLEGVDWILDAVQMIKARYADLKRKGTEYKAAFRKAERRSRQLEAELAEMRMEKEEMERMPPPKKRAAKRVCHRGTSTGPPEPIRETVGRSASSDVGGLERRVEEVVVAGLGALRGEILGEVSGLVTAIKELGEGLARGIANPPPPPRPAFAQAEAGRGAGGGKRKEKPSPGSAASPEAGAGRKRARKGEEAPAPPPAVSPEREGTWAEVTRRKKKVAAPVPAVSSRPAAESSAGPGGAAGLRKKGGGVGGDPPGRGSKARPRPPPETAAISLSIGSGAEMTCGDIMSLAKRSVDLEAIGVTEVRSRRSASGGLLLEIAGRDCGQKADLLAGRLSAVLKEKGVRVARPSKRAEMVVRGLGVATTREEVGAAVAAAASCPEGEVKVGEIRLSPSGRGSAWVQCPAGVAWSVASAGTLQVGWARAQVVALGARPLRCYRCLMLGHVAQRCTSEGSRAGRCHRCGDPAHLVAACSAAAPNCPLCADLGRPAGHVLGGGGCAPPPPSPGAGWEARKPPEPPRGRGGCEASPEAAAAD